MKRRRVYLATVTAFCIALATTAIGGDKAERLRTYDQCHAAAKKADKDRKKGKSPDKRLYKATFDSAHFDFGEYDRMEQYLPLRPEIWFLGAFPPCAPRPDRFLSSFTVAEGEKLALPMDELVYTRMRKLKRAGKLKLVLQFRPTDVKMHPMPAYDAKACPGNQPQFSHDDVAPQVFIHAVTGYVKSKSGKKYRMLRVDDEGSTAIGP